MFFPFIIAPDNDCKSACLELARERRMEKLTTGIVRKTRGFV